MIENIQYHNTTLLCQYSFTFELQSKPFKCFSIIITYSNLFTRKFREYLLPNGVFIYQEKNYPRSTYFLREYDWGQIFLCTGELFVREYIFTVKPGTFFRHIAKKNILRPDLCLEHLDESKVNQYIQPAPEIIKSLDFCQTKDNIFTEIQHL